MLFDELISTLAVVQRTGIGNPDIAGIAYDSRRVAPGCLFVCIRGGKFDGNDFIQTAIENGACAILSDQPNSAFPQVPTAVVPSVREAMPALANRFFDHPSRRLKVVGITGTKGKTTTTYLIESIVRAAGLGAGVIGTMGTRINGVAIPGDRTTPESIDLQELFSRMVHQGVSAVAMEVSSHSLVARRPEGTEFDIGIFTNLTRDHLDFHADMEDYLQTKMRLFTEYPKSSTKPFAAIVNIDDPAGVRVAELSLGRVVTTGIHSEADITATNILASARGVSFDVHAPGADFHVDLALGGHFNVYNSLAAIGAGLALGLSAGIIKAGLESVSSVAGRFESVDCGQDFSVLVDYAHTPDSLENVLTSARELTDKRLIVVFGCGGDRDRGKRPLMGGIGARMADVCIVTSDNPRSEDPGVIIDEILQGTHGDSSMPKEEIAEVEAIADRREAIEHALKIAKPGDIVVIAGKGHETYQIFRNETIHFDDREVVRELLAGC
jgi:UDP-N-acetylmuramoyl-L-alanyl-D-glutamate--2,6-diaminopimelate ligase